MPHGAGGRHQDPERLLLGEGGGLPSLHGTPTLGKDGRAEPHLCVTLGEAETRPLSDRLDCPRENGSVC